MLNDVHWRSASLVMFYSRLLRPILFTRDPEKAHESALALLERLELSAFASRSSAFTHASLATTVAGIDFPNPVGLAAGCDKNAHAVHVWPLFGFGFVEVGTITAEPQEGNPKPRVFRLPEHQAVINRLGFNSEGSERVAERLRQLRLASKKLSVPLGVNIGKTRRVTGEDETLADYLAGYRRLAPFADFVVINVSSPNTPGLRQWQERAPLERLLGAIKSESRSHVRDGSSAPVFVKMSPDMADADMADLVEVAAEMGIGGIVATNTTIERPEPIGRDSETGGLSGQPLRKRANQVMQFLYRESAGKLPLIGVGGISSGAHAYERIRSGASLVQFYTAMIYEGPYLAKHINRSLIALLARDGFKNVSDAVGADVKGL